MWKVEAEAKIYLDNDYKGETLTTQDAAGSDKNFVFGGFAAKNREFIDSLKAGTDSCSSPFRDVVQNHACLRRDPVAGATGPELGQRPKPEGSLPWCGP